ncbi:MAG: outer membrane protein OmpA-like peptidoglycan-associated protein [Oleispira sp.]|jgi:outer membrane protein OmpA-like peptidoglycan-associated protein
MEWFNMPIKDILINSRLKVILAFILSIFSSYSNAILDSISVSDVLVTEGSTASILVTISPAAGEDGQIILYEASAETADGDDYILASNRMTIEAGSTTGVIEIAIPVNDDTGIDLETFKVGVRADHILNSGFENGSAGFQVKEGVYKVEDKRSYGNPDPANCVLIRSRFGADDYRCSYPYKFETNSVSAYGHTGTNRVLEVDAESQGFQNLVITPGVAYEVSLKATRRLHDQTPATVDSTIEIVSQSNAEVIVGKTFTRNNTVWNLTEEKILIPASNTEANVRLQFSTTNDTTIGMIIDDLSVVRVNPLGAGALASADAVATIGIIDSSVTAPQVLISSPYTTNAAAFDVTFLFSEEIDGFDLSDLHISNGTASNLVSPKVNTYQATITPNSSPLENSEIVITLLAGTVTAADDAEENVSSSSTTIYDVVKPIFTITPAGFNTLVAQTVTLNFSESVAVLTLAELAVTNAILSDFTKIDNSTYSVILDPSDDLTEAEQVILLLNAEAISDAAGNMNNEISIEISFDQTAPVITVNGDSIVYSIQGEQYNDSGATATDAIDADIANKLVTINSVDINTIADYSVTYDVTDAAGNAAVQKIRTVKVVVNPIVTIKNYATDQSNIAPVIKDFELAGVEGVTAENLAEINNKIASLTAAQVDSQIKVQAIVDQVIADIATKNAIAKIDTYADDQTNAPTTADYSTAGVNNVTDANRDRVNAAIALLNTGDVDTAAKIQAVADQVNAGIATENAISKIDTYADDQTNAPTTADYSTAGVNNVTDANRDRVNAAIALLNTGDVDTAAKIQAVVDQVNANIATENAIDTIEAYADNNTNTVPTEADYSTAGVTGVTAGNIDAVNAAIDAAVATEADTAAEIQAIVDQVNADLAMAAAIDKIEAYADNNANPVPTEADYSTAGVTDVTAANLAEVNMAIDAAVATEADTAIEIQAIVDQVITDLATAAAISKIDTYADDQANAPTTTDYATAGVNDVTDANRDRVNAAIAALATGEADTAAKIQAIVDQVNKDIATENAISKIDTYADDQTNVPTTADYSTAGVSEVTDANRDRVNAAIALLNTGDVDTAAKIQAVVDQVNANIATENAIDTIEAYADNNTNTVPTEADYSTAGVTGVTAGNIDAVNAAIEAAIATGADTAAEIQGIVDQVIADLATAAAIDKIEAYADNNANPVPTEADYSTAGVTGVTAVNIDTVNAAIEAAIATGADTAAEIQAIVDQVNADIATENAINTIEAYADNNTNTVPTEADYSTAGVTDVTAANLAEVNAAIDAAVATEADTAAEIQTIVDQVIADLATAAAAIDKIEAYADNNANPVPAEADYSTAGVTGVTAGNIDAVNAAIEAAIATGADTAAEIQAIVDQVNADIATENAINTIEAYADNNANPVPTEADYSTAGVTGVTSANLTEVNAAIDAAVAAGADTAAEIQAIVDQVNADIATENAINTIEAYADNNTNTVPAEADYSTAGVTGVTAANLAEVNAAIDAAVATEADTAAEIQAIVDQVNADLATAAAIDKIEAYADNSANPVPTEADYSTAGVTGVTAANLAEVNMAIDAAVSTEADTAIEIQAIVDQVITDLATAAAISKIDTYADDQTNAPTTADYATAGVSDVTDANRDRVNAAIAALATGDADTAAKIQAIVDQVNADIATENAISAIEAYADNNTNTVPTETDYSTAGVSDVTAANLAEVNMAIDAAVATEADTVVEIQTIVDQVITDLATGAAISKIDTYADDQTNAPTTVDYSTAGVNNVTDANRDRVNAAIAALATGDADTAAKIQAIVDQVNDDIATENAINTIEAYADNNANPVPAEADYSTAGVTDVTAANLTEVNAAIDAAVATEADTAIEIQAIVDQVITDLATAAAISKIDTYADDQTNAPTTADYSTAGVNNVTDANRDRVNAAIAALATGDVDTAVKIQAIVDQVNDDIATENAINTIEAYADNNANPVPAEADYSTAGVTDVTAANLAEVNAAIDAAVATDADTAAEIQAIVDQVIADLATAAAIDKIEAYADNNANPVPTEVDYSTAGVTDVTAANLAEVNVAIDAAVATEADTAAEIQAIVNQVLVDLATAAAISKIDTYADDQTNAPTTADYSTADVSDVTDANRDRVNAAIAALATGDVDTAVKIQAIVDQVNADIATENAISAIEAYADNNTNTVPAEADYSTAGVAGVTAANLAEVNAAIDAAVATEADTAVEIQTIVDQVNADLATAAAISKIDTYADDQTNAPTTADYSTAGVNNVTDANRDRVNAAIAALATGDVDTAAKIQAIVDQVNANIATENAISAIEAYADNNTNTAPAETDYSTAGISGVTAGNIDAVNAAIDAVVATEADTVVEIQTIVDQVIADIATENAINTIEAYADNNTNTVPTEADYSTARVTGVTAANLAEVNAAIDAVVATEADTAAEIQAIVDQVNADIATENAIDTIEAYAGNNANTVPTETDYSTAGVTGVTAANIDAVNAAIDAAIATDVDTTAEIQVIVDQIIANIIIENALNVIEDYAASNGTSAALVEQTFIDAGVENSATNLDKVLQAIAAMDAGELDTTEEVQALVDAINANEVDSDGDSIPDVIDSDDDNDGLSDTEETSNIPVTNSNDPDTDNDGLCDGALAVANVCTAGPDGNPTNPDSNNNGICDGPNAVPALDDFKGCMPGPNAGDITSDVDGDLIPDYLDNDSNGSAPTYGDSDNDGIDDKTECGLTLPCRDTDQDGIYDYLDTDSDGDGISDDQEADGVDGNGTDVAATDGSVEQNDTDNDGTPDYLDEDSDNDGKLDIDENSPVGKDTDNDGIPDAVDHDDNGDQSGGGDSDNDGLTDAEECPSYPTNCPDSDGDGKPDYLDNNNDSDDDGISDADEDSNLDKDNNPATNPRDTDGDGIPDYLDDDADNDGKLDSDERDEPYDVNNPRDTDGDGIPDVIDADDTGTNGSGDSDGDGIADNVECPSTPCRDTDSDGIPDYTDTDSDGDGVLDENEVGDNPAEPKDSDADGIPDIVDPVDGADGEKGGDSDGDGVADADECNSWPNCVDSDNDGIADYLDEDSSPEIDTPALAPAEDRGTVKTGVNGLGNMSAVFVILLSLMVLVRRNSAFVLIFPLFFSTFAAQAAWWDEMDLYAGAGYGQSYLNPGVGGTSYSVDDHTQDAWKLTGGWDWNDHISIEGYYSDLGSVELNPGELGYRMLGANAMLHYWARGGERVKGSIALYAKAGLNHMTNNGSNISYESKNQGQLFGAIGAELYLPKKFSVRFEIDSYDADASMLTLNIVKRFGFNSRTSRLPPLPIVEEKPPQEEQFVAMIEELPATAAGPKIVQLMPVVVDSDLDGLLDDEDQCPYTPKNVTINDLGCATYDGKVGDLIANVQFESNSSLLTEPSKIALNEIVSMLAIYTAVKIEVQAHSDNTGSADYNKKLSQRRAESVVKYLATKKISMDRLQALGHGEEKPIADNKTAEGRAKNRRVEFILKSR